MLVLTRKIGEEIVIAGDIHITVVAIKGYRVRLGIAAPQSTPVARLELLDGIGGGTPTHRTVKETVPESRSRELLLRRNR